MEIFLQKLALLLDEHNATILRSTNNTHDLVVSIVKDGGEYEEIHFTEEMSKYDVAIMLKEIIK